MAPGGLPVGKGRSIFEVCGDGAPSASAFWNHAHKGCLGRRLVLGFFTGPKLAVWPYTAIDFDVAAIQKANQITPSRGTRMGRSRIYLSPVPPAFVP